MSRRIGYLRVSKQDQRPDRQVDGLRELCDELHVEKLSAVSAKRPVYEAVMVKLRAGDTLVVWDLDRAFRSTKDALFELDKLNERGVAFQIATMNIDTSTEFGELLYTIVAAFAHCERRMISRRTKEGLAAARLRGRRLGRPPKLTSRQLDRARRALKAKSSTKAEIAGAFGVAPWTLTRALRRQNADLPEDS